MTRQEFIYSMFATAAAATVPGALSQAANQDGSATASRKPPTGRHPHVADTAWPVEDAGPSRQSRPFGLSGPRAGSGRLAAVRQAMRATMVVHAPGGRLLFLRSSIGRAGVSWVEDLDPITLEVRKRSPDLALGPFWVGGMGVLADGAVIVVQGRWAHRLAEDLTVEVSRELPVNAPYNSFVVLDDGSLVMKDLQLPDGEPSTLSILDPVTLDDRAAPLVLPEPSVARITARRNEVFIVGVTALHRILANASEGKVTLREDMRVDYLVHPNQSYGWDPVIDADHVWWMDNGDHTYLKGLTMLGNGVAGGATRLWKAPLDGGAATSVETSAMADGSSTNPPLIDPERGLAVAYDSANGVMAAFGVDDLDLRWRTEINTAQHLWLYPDTGEIVANDYDRKTGDALAIVDIADGKIKARVPVKSRAQGVLLGAPGFERDAYYVSPTTIARVEFGD